MCQTLSHWKCIDPHFCLLGQIGVYSILQLCACSRSLGTSFELLTATIGPRALLLRYLDLFVENALRGEKLGQNRGRGRRILTLNETLLTFGPTTSLQNFISKSNKNCDGRTDRQKDASDCIIRSMLCYSNGTDNNVLTFDCSVCNT